MTALAYARYDLLRVVRNRRFFIFSIGFPLILYLVIAGSNKDKTIASIPFPVYYLTGMTAWGSMNGVVSGGGLISLERSLGWTRQLRVTPLPPWAYMASKVIRGYAMAALTIIFLYLAGLAMSVHLAISGWLLMTGLILVGLLPFAALGIMLGHLLTPDTLGPALGGISALFALLGGAWGPLGQTGAFHDIARALPSYWLVQAGEAGLTRTAWSSTGWIVIAVWTVVLARLAMLAYRRDTAKN
ncbi:MAG TPA: ABC transporter permease [Acidimicrobiales bacterium]|nr:ABC transporter permease [Acidimicrobiales bacterium]